MKELLFQGLAFDFGGPDADPRLGGAAVPLLQIDKALLQGHYLVVQDPLVGVVDHFRLADGPFVPEAHVQMDVLPHYLRHFMVAQPDKYLGPPLGMIPGGAQARGLAQIMEQGAGFDQGERQFQPCGGQRPAQKTGHLPHQAAVLPDVGEHTVGFY